MERCTELASTRRRTRCARVGGGRLPRGAGDEPPPHGPLQEVAYDDPRPLRPPPAHRARRDVPREVAPQRGGEADRGRRARVPAQARPRGRDAGGVRQRRGDRRQGQGVRARRGLQPVRDVLLRSRERAEHSGAARADEGALHRRRARRALLCKDKALAKKLLSFHRVRVARFVVSSRERPLKRLGKFVYPAFVKPVGEESSDGIAQASFARNEDEALERARFLHERFESDAMIEEYIEGRELYVGVLGNKRLTVFPPREIFFGEPPAGRRAEVRHGEGQVGRRLSQEVGDPERPGGRAPAGARAHAWRIWRARSIACSRSAGSGRIDVRLTQDGRGRRHRGQPESVAGEGGRLRAGGGAGGHRLRRAHPEDPRERDPLARRRPRVSVR